MEDYNERFDTLENMLAVLIRQKLSNKQDRLMVEVQKTGFMKTSAIMKLLNISRPHAITLMRQIGEMPGYRCSIADKSKKSVSVLRFDASLRIKDQCIIIKKMFSENAYVTLHQIMEQFELILDDARELAKLFVDAYPEYLLDENKIVVKKL
jgi:hypothetical protein